MNPQDLAGAIDQDVSTDDIKTLTSPESPRMRALASIEESNRKRIEAETGVPMSDDTPLGDQLSAQLAEPDPTPAADPEPRRVTVKVDGLEVEVSEDELIRAYQKNKAADVRLEEAALILRQAQQLAAQTAAIQPDPAPQPQAPSPDVTEELKGQAAELLDKLYDGDKDSAAEALINLLAKTQGGSQPTPQAVQAVVDPDVLTSQVLERIAINTALDVIKSDYPDIVNDPDLEMLAATKINRLVETGKPRSEAMVEVADALYKTLGKTPTGRQKVAEPAVQNKRQENKERLDPIPAASAAAVAPQSPTESSPSSVIAELASRRLGQSLPRVT